MRKVLFVFSARSDSCIEELVAAYPFSDYSVQGVFLQENPDGEGAFPFPCHILNRGKCEKKDASLYPYIRYPEMLKMVFEADTIIS